MQRLSNGRYLDCKHVFSTQVYNGGGSAINCDWWVDVHSIGGAKVSIKAQDFGPKAKENALNLEQEIVYLKEQALKEENDKSRIV